MGPAIFGRLNGETSAEGRIYPEILPQIPTYPAVTYTIVSVVRTHAMGADAKVKRVRAQVDCWGRTLAEARTLAGEVEARLSRYRGTVDGFTVQDVLLDNEHERYEKEAQIRCVSMDFIIFIGG
jgi:hypothetical protein